MDPSRAAETLLPPEMFAGPLLHARTDPDNFATHAQVWADWLETNYDGVPGVSAVLDSVRTGTSDPEAGERGEAVARAAPYLLPRSHEWRYGAIWPDVAVYAKYRGTQVVTVRFASGLPRAISAPLSWFRVFDPAGRLVRVLERFPWVTIYPRGVIAAHPVLYPPSPERSRYGFGWPRGPRTGAVSLRNRDPAVEKYQRDHARSLLESGFVPRCVPVPSKSPGGQSEGPWATEHEARTALGYWLRDYVLGELETPEVPNADRPVE